MAIRRTGKSLAAEQILETRGPLRRRAAEIGRGESRCLLSQLEKKPQTRLFPARSRQPSTAISHPTLPELPVRCLLAAFRKKGRKKAAERDEKRGTLVLQSFETRVVEPWSRPRRESEGGERGRKRAGPSLSPRSPPPPLEPLEHRYTGRHASALCARSPAASTSSVEGGGGTSREREREREREEEREQKREKQQQQKQQQQRRHPSSPALCPSLSSIFTVLLSHASAVTPWERKK